MNRADPDGVFLEIFVDLHGVARGEGLPAVSDLLYVLIDGHDSISFYSRMPNGMMAARLSSVVAISGRGRLKPREPGAWDGFELAVRAVLGQQITVSAARALEHSAFRLICILHWRCSLRIPVWG